MPCAASACNSSQKSRSALGSTPAVGSSSNSKAGECKRHAARARGCLHTPGKLIAALGESHVCERLVDMTPALAHAIHAGDEVQVLAQGQIFPEGKPLRHVADVALDLLGLAERSEERRVG